MTMPNILCPQCQVEREARARAALVSIGRMTARIEKMLDEALAPSPMIAQYAIALSGGVAILLECARRHQQVVWQPKRRFKSIRKAKKGFIECQLKQHSVTLYRPARQHIE